MAGNCWLPLLLLLGERADPWLEGEAWLVVSTERGPDSKITVVAAHACVGVCVYVCVCVCVCVCMCVCVVCVCGCVGVCVHVCVCMHM